MPTVSDILARKGKDVISVRAECTVLDAARIMMEHLIGGVLVCDGDASDNVLGIFTERDVLRRVVAEQRDAATTLVREVMSRELIKVSCKTSLDECSALMTQRRIRHLPVIDDDVLRGIITSGDLLAFRVSEQATMIQTLEHYVFDLR